MTDIISTLGLKGVPELFMLSNEDVERFQGQKAVIAIMATDRTHPEFEKAEQNFKELEDRDDLVIVAEDHADGPLHERFQCKPQEFCFAVIDKAGNTVMRGDHIPTLQTVRERLEMGHA